MKTSLALLLLFTATQSLGQAVVTEATLSTDAAIQIANGALAQCRQDGQKVTVSVVDHAGREKVRVRDDGAAPHTELHAFRKAYTALSYRMTSGEYGKRAAESKGAIGPQLLPNITTAAGGVGHDAKCAEAGIAKVKL
jgi:uncharacterized protein GlcG (DUF336 family)